MCDTAVILLLIEPLMQNVSKSFFSSNFIFGFAHMGTRIPAAQFSHLAARYSFFCFRLIQQLFMPLCVRASYSSPERCCANRLF